MERKMKKVKIITIILAIVLVTLVAFGGVYIRTQNRMENKVKDYAFGREIEGGRVVEIKVVNDEESETAAENLTAENYEIVKRTVEQRLKNLGAQDYTISLNKEDGTIRVELAEDDNTDTYVYFLTANGQVQIQEDDTETELLSDSMVKETVYTYTINAEGQYQVYMELELTKEGQAKIEEIQNNYAILASEIEEIEETEEDEDDHDHENEEATDSEETTEEVATEENAGGEDTTTETAEGEDTTETKKIARLTIAGSEYDIEEIEKNKIRVNIGSPTTNTTYVNNYINVASELALLINSGKYPIEYELQENRFIYSEITNEQIIYFAIAVALIMLVVFIIFIIKYKTKGLLVSISSIGLLSILLLLLRYANVNISIEGIGGIILILIINFIIIQKMLKETKNIDYKELLLKLVPIIIITIVFCFSNWSNLTSFGMVMFWGLILIAVYNLTVTKTLLKLKESK